MATLTNEIALVTIGFRAVNVRFREPEHSPTMTATGNPASPQTASPAHHPLAQAHWKL